MNNRLISLGFVLLLVLEGYLGVLSIINNETTATTWIIDIVDSPGSVGTDTSLALDDNDHAHISYYDNDNYHLKYAKWNGSTWSNETVDAAYSVGMYSSIAVNNSGYPHISYMDYSNYNLKYAKWTGSAWSVETVDSIGVVGYFTSIAINSSDYPCISYLDYTNYNLKIAKWNGSAWDFEIVDSAGDTGSYSSITFDSNDYAHISYYYNSNGDLRYARWNGSAWNIETVESSGDTGYDTSIALDSNEYPHISYYISSPNYDTKYARWNGSAWNIETVDGANGLTYPTSIEIDGDDYAHICYQDSSKSTVKYARWNGSTWRKETVDYGMDVSLELDSSDYPHISYFDTSKLNLKYSRMVPVPSTPRNLQALGGDAQVTLTWDAPNTEGESPITNYTIYRGTSSGGESFLAEIGNVLTFIDLELTNGQIYYYRIAAKNGHGEGLLSNEVYATPATFPDEPTNLEAIGGDSYVNLTWDTPLSDGGFPITNYRIYRATAPGDETFFVEIGNILYYNDTSVINGLPYYYKVSAKNAVGEGALSNDASATPIDNYLILHQGWNLISIPFIQIDTQLGTVLNSINDSYDCVERYNVNDSSDHWKINHTLKPPYLNDLENIDHKMGFWIRITEPGDTIFILNGSKPTENQTINLYPGWNLIGYPSLSNNNRSNALNNIDFGMDVYSIRTYNPTTQKWKELGPSDYFEVGQGYWIYSLGVNTWIVPL